MRGSPVTQCSQPIQQQSSVKLLNAVLGGWGLNPFHCSHPMQGLPLEWSEGDVWTASVDLPPSSVEFKVGGWGPG